MLLLKKGKKPRPHKPRICAIGLAGLPPNSPAPCRIASRSDVSSDRNAISNVGKKGVKFEKFGFGKDSGTAPFENNPVSYTHLTLPTNREV